MNLKYSEIIHYILFIVWLPLASRGWLHICFLVAYLHRMCGVEYCNAQWHVMTGARWQKYVHESSGKDTLAGVILKDKTFTNYKLRKQKQQTNSKSTLAVLSDRAQVSSSFCCILNSYCFILLSCLLYILKINFLDFILLKSADLPSDLKVGAD